MPTKIHFDDSLHLVQVIISGTWGLSEALTAFDEILAAPDFRRGMDILVDLREARIVPAPGDAQKLATHVRMHQHERGSGYKLAIVAVDGIERVVAETYQSLVKAQPMRAQVFVDPIDAETWIQSSG